MSQLYEYFQRLSEGKLDVTKTVEYQFVKTLAEIGEPVGLNEFAKELNMTSIVSHLINLMTKGGLMRQSPEGIDTSITLPEVDEAGRPVGGGDTDSPSQQSGQVSPPGRPTSGQSSVPSAPTGPSSGSSGPSIPPGPSPTKPQGSSGPPGPSRGSSPPSSVPRAPQSQQTQPTSQAPGVTAMDNSQNLPPQVTPTPQQESSDPDVNEAVNKLKEMTSKLRQHQLKEEQQRKEQEVTSKSSVPGPQSSIPRPKVPPTPKSNEEPEDEDEEVPAHIKGRLAEERARTGSKKDERDDIDDIFGNLGSLEDELDD